MTAKHTQGRLSVGTPYTNADDGSREVPLMGGPEGLLFIAVAIGGLVGQDENARRIVAAWNACQGIPTEVLEAQQSGGLPWSVTDQIEARVVLTDLLDALKMAVWAMRAPIDEWKGEVEAGALRAANAAIARATGEL